MQGRPRSACKGGCLATGAGSQPGPRRRGPHRRGVAPGAVGSLPAGRWRPEAGRSHRTATRMEIRCWLIVCGMSGQRGVGGELGWLPPVHTRAALLTAVPRASASSTFCAARPPTREASAACHVGLNYEHCTVCKGCGMWLGSHFSNTGLVLRRASVVCYRQTDILPEGKHGLHAPVMVCYV